MYGPNEFRDSHRPETLFYVEYCHEAYCVTALVRRITGVVRVTVLDDRVQGFLVQNTVTGRILL